MVLNKEESVKAQVGTDDSTGTRCMVGWGYSKIMISFIFRATLFPGQNREGQIVFLYKRDELFPV